jgi:hypothetical protein
MCILIEIARVHNTLAERVVDCLRRFTGCDRVTIWPVQGGMCKICVPDDEFGINHSNRLRFFVLGVTYGLTYEVKNETA